MSRARDFSARRAARRAWIAAVLIPIAILAAKTICLLPAPGLPQLVPRMSLELGFLCGTGLILISPLLLLVHLIKSILPGRSGGQRLRSLAKAGSTVLMVSLLLAGMFLEHRLRNRAFALAANRGEPIISALERFHKEKGSYPDTLQAMIPDYLPAPLFTGLIGYPEFHYWKDHNRTPESYELSIFCPSGGINFDRFIYWPSQAYPDTIQDNGVERIGAWAYVHE